MPRWSHREILTKLQIPNSPNATYIVPENLKKAKENAKFTLKKLPQNVS